MLYYVLLTPKNILTRDETWINRSDLYDNFISIPRAIPNDQLRSQINNYLRSVLPKKATKDDYRKAASLVIEKFPEVLDYYILTKEKQSDRAVSISNEKVKQAETQFISQIQELTGLLKTQSDFFNTVGKTLDESLERVRFLKDVIENKDGYRLFYVDGVPIERENDLQIMYRLTWFATDADVNREVNNGRGPVDFKVSVGRRDSTLVEFKLAKNTQLKRNLQNQIEIYKKSSDTKQSIKVILFFTKKELDRVKKILKELKIESDPHIILIDARRDNKPSASKA